MITKIIATIEYICSRCHRVISKNEMIGVDFQSTHIFCYDCNIVIGKLIKEYIENNTKSEVKQGL